MIARRFVFLFFCALIATCGHGAFLSSKLPLGVISITPTRDSWLSARSTLTVVFSRPVIALGSETFIPSPTSLFDPQEEQVPFYLVVASSSSSSSSLLPVPGKYRWVTTYMARFDSDIDWPLDLDFSLVINPHLKSFDGLALVHDSNVTTTRYKTRGLSAYIVSVSSPQATAVTGGLWDAFTGLDVPEVPPDGIIRIAFSSPVDLTYLRRVLTEFGLQSCSATNTHNETSSSCVDVNPGPLALHTRYVFHLPNGTLYHPLSDPLQTSIRLSFSSLVPFTLPFRSYSLTETTVRYRRFDLWIRHGGFTPTKIQQLRACLTLSSSSPPLDFTLAPLPNSTASFRLSAEFSPEQTYTLVVAECPHVVDGFQLPLRAHNYSFTTAPLPSFFVEGYGSAVFENLEPRPLNWTLLERTSPMDTQHPGLDLFRVTPQNILETLAVLDGGYAISSQAAIITTGTHPSSAFAVRSFGFDLPLDNNNQSSNNSLLFLRRHNWDTRSRFASYLSWSLTSITDVGISTVAYPNHLTVLVTQLSTAAPVSNCEVFLFNRLPSSWPPNYEMALSGWTNHQGLCAFNLSSSSFSSAAVYARCSAQDALLPHIDIPRSAEPKPSVILDLITDRLVYKPGDIIYTKLFVSQTQDQDQNTNSWKIRIQWTFAAPETWSIVNVTSLSAAGTFACEISIPSHISAMGTKQLEVWDEKTNQLHAYKTFLLADPRKPTASLQLTGPDALIVNQSWEFTATTKTATGGPIADADVTLTWTEKEKENKQVTVVVRTNSEGKALWVLFLNDTQRGSPLQVTATWMGPVGEYLTSTYEGVIVKSRHPLSITTIPIIPIPGLPFAVYITPTGSLSSSSSSSPSLLSMELVSSVDGTVIGQCNNEEVLGFSWTSDSAKPICYLTVPTVGHFLLKTRLQAEETETEEVLVGWTLAEWQQQPLTSLPLCDMHVEEKEEVQSEKTVRVEFFNYYYGATLLVSHTTTTEEQVILKLPSGHGHIIVNYTQASKRNEIKILMLVPRQDRTEMFADIAVSGLLDVSAPAVLSWILSYTESETPPSTVASLPLTLTLSLGEEHLEQKIRPGQEVEVLLDVGPETEEKAEVCLIVVDKAYLHLTQLYPLPRLNETMVWRPTVPLSQILDSRSSLASWLAYNATVEKFSERIRMDPWITPTWPLLPTWYYQKPDLDSTDEEYWNAHTSPLTYFPSPSFSSYSDVSWYSYSSSSQPQPMHFMRMESASPSAMMTDKSSNEAQHQQQHQSGVRQNLQPVAYFVGQREEQASRISFRFKLPDNIGTWVARAFVVRGSKYGQTELEFVASKAIQMEAMLPRFVRPGDRFTAGVTISLDDGSAPERNITVTLGAGEDGGMDFVPVPRVIALHGTTPVRVEFDMQGKHPGETRLLFTAEDEDALMVNGTVIAAQDVVEMSTSMALRGGNVWEEGLVFPATEFPDQATLTIVSAVGHFPGVSALVRTLRQDQEQQINAEQLVGQWATFPILATYQVRENPNEQKEKKDALLTELEARTIPGCGLRYFLSGVFSSSSCHEWRDGPLNAFALFVFQRLETEMIPLMKDERLGTLTEQWRNALSADLTSKYATNETRDYDLVAWAALAMGSRSVHEIVPLDTFRQHWKDLAFVSQLLYVYAHLQSSTLDLLPSGGYDEICTELISRIRVQGRTAYISGEGVAGSDLMQALGLMLLVKSPAWEEHPFVEKLAHFVALGNEQKAGCLFVSNSRDSVFAMLALTAYDFRQTTTTTKTDVELEVRYRERLLQKTSWITATQPAEESVWPWSTFSDQKLKTLYLNATGSGQVSVGLTLRFIPKIQSVIPLYRGLYVERLIQNVEASRTGLLYAGHRGQLLQVTVQITTPDYLENVIVEDMLAGGLEVIDATKTNDRERFWTIWDGGRGDGFDEAIVLLDRVQWVARFLYPGTYSVTYKVLAVTPGIWFIPPAKVRCLTNPGLMGLSAGMTFVITALPLTPHQLEQFYIRYGLSLPPPQHVLTNYSDCSPACSSNEACDLRFGSCVRILEDMEFLAQTTDQKGTTEEIIVPGVESSSITHSSSSSSSSSSSGDSGLAASAASNNGPSFTLFCLFFLIAIH